MGCVFGTRDKQETCLGCFDGDILRKVISLKPFNVKSLKTFQVVFENM